MNAPSGTPWAVAAHRPSAWVLVAVNLGLLYGVLALDWDVFSIVLLYWAENLVIGAINVLRMLVSNPAPDVRIDSENLKSAGLSRQERLAALGHLGLGLAMKLFLVPFFILHYGGFCVGHGIFVFALFDQGDATDVGSVDQALALLQGPLGWSLALLAASHLFSFFSNFLVGGEYRRTNAAALMMRPYGRIVVLHVTIILGGFLTMAFGNPIGLLVVLVVLKTAVDLGLHLRERNVLA